MTYTAPRNAIRRAWGTVERCPRRVRAVGRESSGGFPTSKTCGNKTRFYINSFCRTVSVRRPGPLVARPRGGLERLAVAASQPHHLARSTRGVDAVDACGA